MNENRFTSCDANGKKGEMPIIPLKIYFSHLSTRIIIKMKKIRMNEIERTQVHKLCEATGCTKRPSVS